MTTSLNLADKQVLFEHGAASDTVYLLESGELEAFTVSRGRTTVLGRITPGEFVGELGVLQGQTRGASVRATVGARLTAYTRAEFIDLISRSPEHCLKLMHSLSLRTRTLLDLLDEVNRKIHQQRPQSLSRAELWWRGFFSWLKVKMAGQSALPLGNPIEERSSGTIRLKPDEILFLEGQDSHIACKLLTGKLKVVRSSGIHERSVGAIRPGEFVGEIGLLEGTPRSATVKALVRSEVEVFDQHHFHKLIEHDSEVGRLMIDTLSKRSIQLGRDCQRLSDAFANQLDRPSLARVQDLLKSVSEAYQVTGERVERDFQALQRGMALEAAAAKGMAATYYRFMKDEVTSEEMEEANAEFRNLLKSLGIGTLFLLPGAVITIPIAVKAARSLGIEILPKKRPDED